MMLDRRPFNDFETVFRAAEEIWNNLGPDDWKEAFACHPKIGDVEGLRSKFAATAMWAAGEQSGVKEATERTLHQIAAWNEEYERKFGHIFIVCATSKSADDMLTQLKHRITNAPDEELLVAAREQARITKIRLEKLFE